MRCAKTLTAFILLFSVCFTQQSFALGKKNYTSYYVDAESGNDANSGKSMYTPWQTIQKVNSTSFLPGDRIFFKRGCFWLETLEITSSGNALRPIVYGAYGAQELPKPVIDAELIRNNCVYQNGKNYITIKDLSFRNAAGSGAIRIMYSTGVRVENCSFYVTSHGGVFIENSNSCVITGNTITSPETDLDKQTDGIYSQRNSDNTYEKNNIILTNPNALQHIDGIQSYIDNNLTVRDNYIYQQNTKTNSQGIYATTGSGVHTYFNNILNCPNTVANVMGFKNLSAGTATLRAYHNTLIGKGANIITVTGDPAPVIKNNIFIALSPTHGIIRIDSTCISPSEINFNIYKNGGSSVAVTYKGTNLTFDQWKALGFESDGMFADPFLQPDFTLAQGSPGINKGYEIGGLCSHDKAGTLRPQMGIVDIGAYESFYAGKTEEWQSQAISFQLFQNYPNPFNPSTVIKFSLPETSEITLKVYDLLGREIVTLAEGVKPEGTYEINFDAGSLSSGMYVYQLNAGKYSGTGKMSLVK